LRGATLDDKLRAGAMPIAEALRLSRELVSVLKAVHEHGYIHRDLKPANIFLVPGDDGLEHIKVIDFGVARRISLSAQDSARLKQTLRGIGEKHTVQTMRGIIFGTPAYMSPEQAMGLTLGARSDLYALGCVMYEMLTGTAPFETKEVMKALWDHIAVPPQSLRERTPDAHIPEELDALVLKLLRKKPAERFKDAAAVLTALDVAAGVLPRTALAKTETQRPAAPAAAPGWPKLVAVALLVACASVALVLWLSKPTAPAEVARPATSAPPPIHQHAGPEITPAVDTSEAPEPTPAASVSVAPTAAPTHPNHSIPYGNTQPSPTSKTPATHNPQPTPDPNYELPELRGVK
ncbi:MAG: protein kinase, partial [Myxococcales bacterium]|nr:protein kinase [Myxococcales bacterium]